VHFFIEVFSQGVANVDGDFQFGKHIVGWCARLQEYMKTLTVSARFHIKSTVALGKIAWRLYRMDRNYEEWLFMGYNEDLAEYQLRRLNRYIKAIPEYFDDYQRATDAESKVHYIKDGREFICEPSGIMTFKRGRHPYGLICDDILKDPEVRLSIAQLKKIEEIFVEQIMSMPTHELHVFGTPQDPEDLFARLNKMPSFNCREYKAIINEALKEVLWPEVWSFERCTAHRTDIGVKAFNKEFQCHPVRSQEGYFEDEEITEIINAHLRGLNVFKKHNLREYCYAGLDLGKKRHPSHLSIYGKDRLNRLVQVASIWMDHWDYTRQLELCRAAIDNLGIRTLFYDDTRAEFEGFREVGDLPGEMKGIVFTQKAKQEMALEFERKVRAKNIILLPDERQRRQILNVDNDLQSVASYEGHGDAFYSNALAIKAAEGPKANIRYI
jgi:hypothetical protein